MLISTANSQPFTTIFTIFLCLAFARVARVCFTWFLFQTLLHLARWCWNSLQLLGRHKVFAKGTFLCIHPAFFSTLCCLSSALLQLHWIGMLQFICRGSNSFLVTFPQTVWKSTRVAARAYARWAKNLLAQWWPNGLRYHTPGLQHLSPKETSPCLPSLRIPPSRSRAAPCCPHALPERFPFCLRRKQFLQTQEAFVQFKHSDNPRNELR